jgi:hypothetical protein
VSNQWTTPFRSSRNSQGRIIPSEAAAVRDALKNRNQFLSPTLGNTFDIASVQPPVAQTITADTTAEESRHLPQAVYDPQKYGDAVMATIPVAAGVDTLALPRAMGARLLLVIYNPTLAPLYYAFGSEATVTSMPITSGNYAFFDAVVPQNDLHFFNAAGGNIPVQYINALPIGVSVGAAPLPVAPLPVALGASVSEKLFQANGNQLLGVR